MVGGFEYQSRVSEHASRVGKAKITSAASSSPPSFIDILPSELLAAIFEFAAHSSHSDRLALRLACQKWSEIVTATPTIWTSIECNVSPSNAENLKENLPNVLFYSKALPIDVKFRLLPNSERQVLDDVFASLALHSSRLQSLTVIAAESTGFMAFEKFWGETSSKASFLHTLHIHNYEHDNNSSASGDKLSAGITSDDRVRAPNLSSLTLSGHVLNAFVEYNNSFSHVSSLTFVGNALAGTMPSCLSALENLPSLAHLTFRDISCMMSSVFPPYSVSQALSSLTFEESNVEFINSVLCSLLHAPKRLSFLDCLSLPSELVTSADTLEIRNPSHFSNVASALREWSGTKLILCDVHFVPHATVGVFFLPTRLKEVDMDGCCCYSIDALKDAIERRLIDSDRSNIEKLVVRKAGQELEPDHMRWLRDYIAEVSWAR